MPANRRTWLKQIGLGMAGFSIAPLESFATTTGNQLPDPFLQDQPLRLSSNENPYGPSPAAISAMTAAIRSSNRYNWNITSDLIKGIADKHQLGSDNVLVSAGSTEILDLLARYYGAGKGSFVISHPTFSYWAQIAEKAGFKKITVPLTADKKQDLPAMLAAITTDTSMVYVCNPNNPTGTLCDAQQLKSFIAEASKKATVIIDEAYLDFTTQPSACSMVANNKNLIIVKTFSKIYGLAGGRIGYALGHPDTLESIARLQTWANGDISLVSRAAALASLGDDAFVKQCIALNDKARAFTIEQLQQLNCRCIPSSSNFIYFSLAGYEKDFFGLLKQQKVQGTYIYEEDGKWTRITVGTMDEMKQFIRVIS